MSPRDTILTACARAFAVRVPDILGKHRYRSIAQARKTAAYLLRTRLFLSYPEIARVFGHSDHSSAMDAHRSVVVALALASATQIDTPLTARARMAMAMLENGVVVADDDAGGEAARVA